MVNNSFTSGKNPENQECVYMAGETEVRLTPDFVKKYLVSGDADKVTMQEIVMFLNFCKGQRLNPFLREAYLIKYGNSPASNVVAKTAFEKRAFRNERYRGFKAGIIVITKNGEIQNRTGAFYMNDEIIVGGWCNVFIEGLEPVSVVVSFQEYAGYTKDGKLNSQWAKRPATMIRKTAKVQALREAFPEDFSGMYTAEERGFETEDIEIPPAPEDEKEQTDEFSEIMNG